MSGAQEQQPTGGGASRAEQSRRRIAVYGASRDKKPCVPTAKTVWEGVYNWLGLQQEQ